MDYTVITITPVMRQKRYITGEIFRFSTYFLSLTASFAFAAMFSASSP